eukprot:scaffold233_cov81-Cylindrotheca_fusiformis.AAC.2
MEVLSPSFRHQDARTVLEPSNPSSQKQGPLLFFSGSHIVSTRGTANTCHIAQFLDTLKKKLIGEEQNVVVKCFNGAASLIKIIETGFCMYRLRVQVSIGGTN